MDKRKRLLAGLLGSLVIFFAAHWAWAKYVTTPIGELDRSNRLAEEKTQKLNHRLVEARTAKLDLEELGRASLPNNPALAQEQYQAYLIQLLQSSKIPNSTITPSQPTEREGVYFVPFTVQAETDIQTLTRLLHSFYSSHRLQQIRRLSLNPIERADMGPGIRFSLSIEALGFAESESAEPPAGMLEVKVAKDPTEYSPVVERNVLFARGPGGTTIAGNSPEHVVLTGILHGSEGAEADLYDRAVNQTRRVRVGDAVSIGTVSAKILDLGLRDMVLEAGGDLCHWRLGESFAARQSLTAEAALEREIRKSRPASASK